MFEPELVRTSGPAIALAYLQGKIPEQLIEAGRNPSPPIHSQDLLGTWPPDKIAGSLPDLSVALGHSYPLRPKKRATISFSIHVQSQGHGREFALSTSITDLSECQVKTKAKGAL